MAEAKKMRYPKQSQLISRVPEGQLCAHLHHPSPSSSFTMMVNQMSKVQSGKGLLKAMPASLCQSSGIGSPKELGAPEVLTSALRPSSQGPPLDLPSSGKPGSRMQSFKQFLSSSKPRLGISGFSSHNRAGHLLLVAGQNSSSHCPLAGLT